VTIALITSWVVAVVFTPYIGFKLLDPKKLIAKAQRHGEDITTRRSIAVSARC